jgi:SOS-response transcriptional repressor LexA
MKQPTVKQQELLNFIADYQKQYNTPPTFVEMASKFGLSIAAIQSRLNALERKKIIQRKNIYIIKS